MIHGSLAYDDNMDDGDEMMDDSDTIDDDGDDSVEDYFGMSPDWCVSLALIRY